jgi:hypothetical protein
MGEFQSAACIRCDKSDCGADIIIAAVKGNLKSVDRTGRRIQVSLPRMPSLPVATSSFHRLPRPDGRRSQKRFYRRRTLESLFISLKGYSEVGSEARSPSDKAKVCKTSSVV